MKLKAKMILLGLLPISLLTVIVCFSSYEQINAAMNEQIESQLTSVGMLMEQDVSLFTAGVCYNNFHMDNGFLRNGSTLINESRDMCDKIKESTAVDISIYYGDAVAMTTVKTASGDRIDGETAPAAAISHTLEGGEEYFSDEVTINGIQYYGYFRPLYNGEVFGNADVPVCMVFTGMPAADVIADINNIVVTMCVIAVIVALLSAVLIVVTAVGISKRINGGIKILEAVSTGDLTVEIPDKSLKGRDEVGELSRAIAELKHKFIRVVSEIVEHSYAVQETSTVLGKEATESSLAVETVERAVQDIATGASSQADETQSASDSVVEMGLMIEETNAEVKRLQENADSMEQAGLEANDVLDKLQAINKRTVESIAVIAEQTNTTNDSAKKIAEATNLITDIAEETSLLSLNASIEAARAGEAGRGFAVVADQISKLADQSDASARRIEEIIGQLILDSKKSVETMTDVQKIMTEQSEMVTKTGEIFEGVIEGIRISREEIDSISRSAEKLDKSRESVVQVVETLSAVAQENMASTQETSASTTQVSASIQEMTSSATMLQDISTKLEDSVNVFKIS